MKSFLKLFDAFDIIVVAKIAVVITLIVLAWIIFNLLKSFFKQNKYEMIDFFTSCLKLIGILLAIAAIVFVGRYIGEWTVLIFQNKVIWKYILMPIGIILGIMILISGIFVFCEENKIPISKIPNIRNVLLIFIGLIFVGGLIIFNNSHQVLGYSIMGVAVLLLWLFALIDCLVYEKDKTPWILILFFLNGLGGILYLAIRYERNR